ncbi:MAG: lipid-A-disaccharide synthase [Betaproteobacteria bacterium]|nr:MAG: lipid-A-disaccharide synthase [Betaproteobacteria bacterium]
MTDVVIVAGETSGDQLAAHLVSALRAANPALRFYGVAGPKMRAAGVEAWFDCQSLAVRGYTEVLTALPRILGIKRDLLARIQALKPALYIGVDAPDFNLRIERSVKALGIKTLHYVCPSFWAWREARAAKFSASADHMLCVFPFEPALLAPYQMPATFVGHPLATAPLVGADRGSLRKKIELHADEPLAEVIAVLPGSRMSELNFHASLFVLAIKRLHEKYPRARFLVPLPTRETRQVFEAALWRHAPECVSRVSIMFGHADFALRVADVALVASGTATLEAAMLDCPQVVSYRISALTYLMVKRKLRMPWVSLPNVLAKDWCVPELLQKAATPEALSNALETLLTDSNKREAMRVTYAQIRSQLVAPAGDPSAAVAAVMRLIAR